jgi:glycosyltransferase involved in cell wall biosynthesis
MTRPRLPAVSVVIPTFNRCAVVEATLEHLLAQDYPADRFEVLVCDNSTDATPEMVEATAARAGVAVRLLRSGHRLPAVKRNEGLRAAAGELVLFFNDDCWAHPRLLREHARSHARAAEPVAVLGHVAQSPMMPQTSFVAWFEPFAYHEIAERADRTVSYRYAWSMNLSFPRREMLARNLLFHEDWAVIGHEDVELGHRWVAAGRSIVYNPAARAEHYHPHDLASACRVQAGIGAGLRDLEALVDDPGLLERYGVFSWRNRPRAVARGVARRVLFNGVTVPPVQRWLEGRPRGRALDRWLYWKVLLHHTNRGYRRQAPRHPQRTPFLPPVAEVSR